ncbi:hypothetical protein I5907_05240 [Panacibacter sp. DH6]|uniref:Cytochrome c domain-containing protein n=1 Tax=Panacibacter microcysteis TaxID=2793269 RepID=A0A931GYE8_9BACT|nr:c-type cytochrome domain-containing protein [Panacibacter microcysteis]MBG9375627.1 hypothetical protein [Panacibacter microcysteis]
MKRISLLLIVAAGLFFACKHQVINPDGGGDGNGSDTTGNNGGNGDTLVCFEADVLPIFQTSCAKSGCHDAATHEEGYVLDSYANIVKKGIDPGRPNDSKIFEEIVDGDMPPNGEPNLTNEQIATIRQWILEGAKNTNNCSSCDAAVFTYSAAIAPIMTTNCVACHSATLQNGGVNLSTYEGVKSAANSGALIGTVTHAAGFSPMPQGGNKLSDCNIAQIQQWIDDGMKNN